MQIIIEDDYLEGVIRNGKETGKPKFPREVISGFLRKIGQMKSAKDSNDLRAIKSLHFEKLSGTRKGRYSIRVNNCWRIIFRIDNNERIEILAVEELSNHYG
ncbi:MAG: addiction module killer protein [Parapedobacter sp.]|nr:MAG: addiction module killer protein [Parapedobacter sp.]